MPRVYPPKRTSVTVRLNRDGVAEMDRRAREAGVHRSEMVRRMLRFAIERMPR